MKIGVISDTHDQGMAIEKMVEQLNEEVVQLVVHCGDWVAPFILYRTYFKIRDFDFEKAPGFDDRKRPHIINIRPLTIVESRELSLCQKPNLEGGSIYISSEI